MTDWHTLATPLQAFLGLLSPFVTFPSSILFSVSPRAFLAARLPPGEVVSLANPWLKDAGFGERARFYMPISDARIKVIEGKIKNWWDGKILTRFVVFLARIGFCIYYPSDRYC